MSLQLHLSGFRCYYQPTDFNFDPNQLIRIKGPSGVGKSTLLEAIQWVLYNYPNKNNYSWGDRQKKCTVELRLPMGSSYLTIRRSTNPSRLQLTHPDGHQEEGEVAQATIHSKFSDKTTWRISCYLPQNENCPLLSFSNAERMEILRNLTFLNENPDEIIAKVEEEMSRLNQEIKVAQRQLDQQTKNSPSFDLPGNPDSYLLSSTNYNQKLADKASQQAAVDHLTEEIIRAEEQQKYRQTIQRSLEEITRKLAKIPVVTSEEINHQQEILRQYHEELSMARQQRDLQKLLTERDQLMTKLASLPSNSPQYSDNDYQEATYQERHYQEERKITTKWRLPYEEAAITQRKNQLTSILTEQKEAKVWRKIQELRKKLKPSQDNPVKSEDLNKLRQHLQQLENSRDILKCPACHRSLRYLRGNLVLSETSPVNEEKIKEIRQQLRQLEKSYQEWQDQQNLQTQLHSLQETVESTHPPSRFYSPEEIRKLQQELTELSRLTFPVLPEVSSQKIKLAQEYWHLKDQLIKLDDKISSFEVTTSSQRSVEQINRLIHQQQDKLKKLQDSFGQRNNLLQQQAKYQKDLDSIPVSHLDDLKERRNDHQSHLEKITTQLDNHQQAQRYLDHQQTIKKYQQTVDQLQEELSGATRLRDIAYQEVCDILESKISSINNFIEEVCEKIFREPINVKLTMTKTSKTTKVTKPCVHFNILYHDTQLDSLTYLSGGESKRISIATSIALAKLNNFPLLLLDECLAGLDEDLKEAVLGILKETGKTVLCVMHDGVEGYYDRIIEL